MSIQAPTKVSDQSYDLAAFVAFLGDVPVEDDAKTLYKKSRDFFWFSPVLKRQLEGKVADLLVTPRDEADVMRVASAAARYRVRDHPPAFIGLLCWAHLPYLPGDHWPRRSVVPPVAK
jgi:hypothetical protein